MPLDREASPLMEGLFALLKFPQKSAIIRDHEIRPRGYHMNIPLKWGVDGGPYTHDAGHVVQTVSVQTNGTVSVSKFGITARRKPNEDYQ